MSSKTFYQQFKKQNCDFTIALFLFDYK